MQKTGGRDRGEKGLSARQLVLLFLAGVAVCAVFFSLGFLVGFNERFSTAAPATEHVALPRLIPPTVNPPLETSAPVPKAPATDMASEEQAPGGSPGQISTETVAEPKPVTPPASSTAASTLQDLGFESAGGGAHLPPATPSEEVGTGFTIQVAATTTKQDAEAVVEKLKARGYPVLVVTPEYARANDNLFRVQVGPYTLRDEAENVRQKLAQEGFKHPFIKR